MLLQKPLRNVVTITQSTTICLQICHNCPGKVKYCLEAVLLP